MNPTVLEDRLLLANGVSVIDPSSIETFFLKGLTPNQLLVTESNSEIEFFNNLAESPLDVFNLTAEVSNKFNWKIPQEYLELNLEWYFTISLGKFTDEAASERIKVELEQVKKYDFENGLRAIIFVIDELNKNKVIYGVGRGSSCASYLLYLLGVHCVDPLKYNIHYSEFFHD